jgi:hypothetical protein
MAFHAYVSLGWLRDGRWWVEDSRANCGWIYAGATSAQARTAAEAKVAKLMAEPYDHGVRWEPTIAAYEPGVPSGRAASVPEWPPGHDTSAASAPESRNSR